MLQLSEQFEVYCLYIVEFVYIFIDRNYKYNIRNVNEVLELKRHGKTRKSFLEAQIKDVQLMQLKITAMECKVNTRIPYKGKKYLITMQTCSLF